MAQSETNKLDKIKNFILFSEFWMKNCQNYSYRTVPRAVKFKRTAHHFKYFTVNLTVPSQSIEAIDHIDRISRWITKMPNKKQGTQFAHYFKQYQKYFSNSFTQFLFVVFSFENDRRTNSKTHFLVSHSLKIIWKSTLPRLKK